MEHIVEEIGMYRQLCLACIAGAVLSAGYAVYLFIRLDIRGVIGYLSGLSERRGIRRLQKRRGGFEDPTAVMGGKRC